ncbi:MAG: hypothetical protein PVJ71_03660, partial [Lysobacterales bacterium]
LDLDWLWRAGLVRLLRAVAAVWTRIGSTLGANLDRLGRRLSHGGRRFFGSRTEDGRHVFGLFARAWPIGTTALWIAVLLTAYVFFYYIA